MSDASDYMSPEQAARDAADRFEVRQILDQAAADGVSLVAAMQFGEPAEVVDMWVDRLWDGLRDNLDEERRLLALVMLLEPRMVAGACRLAHGHDLDTRGGSW